MASHQGILSRLPRRQQGSHPRTFVTRGSAVFSDAFDTELCRNFDRRAQPSIVVAARPTWCIICFLGAMIIRARRIVGLLLVLLGASSARAEGFEWPTGLFGDQFESGDLFSFGVRTTSGGGTLGVSSETVWSGRWAAHAEISGGGTAYLSASMSQNIPRPEGKIYFGAVGLRFEDTNISTGQLVGLLAPSKIGVGRLDTLSLKRKSTGELILNSSIAGDTAAVLQPGVWYHVEAAFQLEGGTATVTYWVDGEQLLSGTKNGQTNSTERATYRFDLLSIG